MPLNALQSIFDIAPSLHGLSEEARRRLERVAEQRQYRRRHVIHFADQPGDYVFLLGSGRVKIVRASDHGREVTLYLIEPGEIFGEEALSELGAQYGVTAETLDTAQVFALRRTDFLAAFHESPEASLDLIRALNHRRAMAEAKIADLVFLDVPKRLAKLLLRLYDDLTEPRDDGLISSKYTHQELANLIGSTRETTTLVLNEFRRQGTIDFLGRKIIIRRRDELESLLRRNSSSRLPA